MFKKILSIVISAQLMSAPLVPAFANDDDHSKVLAGTLENAQANGVKLYVPGTQQEVGLENINQLKKDADGSVAVSAVPAGAKEGFHYLVRLAEVKEGDIDSTLYITAYNGSKRVGSTTVSIPNEADKQHIKASSVDFDQKIKTLESIARAQGLLSLNKKTDGRKVASTMCNLSIFAAVLLLINFPGMLKNAEAKVGERFTTGNKLMKLGIFLVIGGLAISGGCMLKSLGN